MTGAFHGEDAVGWIRIDLEPAHAVFTDTDGLRAAVGEQAVLGLARFDALDNHISAGELAGLAGVARDAGSHKVDHPEVAVLAVGCPFTDVVAYQVVACGGVFQPTSMVLLMPSV